MAIFNSYVKLPEGSSYAIDDWHLMTGIPIP